MSQDVYVAGVGMIPFAKPGASDPYHVMGARAMRAALDDAGLVTTKSSRSMRAMYSAIPAADSAPSMRSA